MTTPAKRKGDAAELEAARLLAELTGWPVRRKLGAGRADDTGDLDGIPDTCVQVKNYPSDLVRAIRETLAELPAQQTNAGATYAFGLIRRPGGRWFAVLDLDNLCALLREATDPDYDPNDININDFCLRCGHPWSNHTGKDCWGQSASGDICRCEQDKPGSLSPNHPTTRRILRQRAGIE